MKTTYGHSAFEFAAPNDWNVLQKLLKLETNIPVYALKNY